MQFVKKWNKKLIQNLLYINYAADRLILILAKSHFLQPFKYVESRALSGINIIGHDILGLGRVTYFEALVSLACLTRMSEFHVGNSLA